MTTTETITLIGMIGVTIVFGMILGFLIARIFLKRKKRKLEARAGEKILSGVKMIIDGKEYNLKEGTVKKVEKEVKPKIKVPKEIRHTTKDGRKIVLKARKLKKKKKGVKKDGKRI